MPIAAASTAIESSPASSYPDSGPPPGPDDGVDPFHALSLSQRLPCRVASKCHIGTQEPHAAGQIRNRSDHELCGICRILIILHNFVCQGDMEMVGINLLLPHHRSGKNPLCFWLELFDASQHSD